MTISEIHLILEERACGCAQSITDPATRARARKGRGNEKKESEYRLISISHRQLSMLQHTVKRTR